MEKEVKFVHPVLSPPRGGATECRRVHECFPGSTLNWCCASARPGCPGSLKHSAAEVDSCSHQGLGEWKLPTGLPFMLLFPGCPTSTDQRFSKQHELFIFFLHLSHLLLHRVIRVLQPPDTVLYILLHRLHCNPLLRCTLSEAGQEPTSSPQAGRSQQLMRWKMHPTIASPATSRLDAIP